MVVKGLIKKGEYFDSVALMLVAKGAAKIEGVEDAAIVMGTAQNKSILEMSDMLLEEFKDTSDNDLIIAVKANDEAAAVSGLKKTEELLEKSRQKTIESSEYMPKSIESALKVMPGANMVIVSVAGKYAAEEAMKALQHDLHVMIFSNNVPKDKTLEVKKLGREKGLLVMGPDCGTAIINGASLGFSNVVNRGDIGIVSAAGTGLQEVSSIISNEGGGISQGIGTGGIDMKKEFGGLSFLTGLEALVSDPQTKVIILISKPLHPEVLERVGEVLKTNKKSVVAAFLGADPALVKSIGAIPASSLEEAALLAVSLSKGISMDQFNKEIEESENSLKEFAKYLSKELKPEQKYFRGLFQGGTLAYETQVILKDMIDDINSNVPLDPELKLADSWKSVGHTVVDLGEDEFTVGRPHPQIDFSLRNKRILEEAHDKNVAIIYLDVVIGHGTNLNPGDELAPVIAEAKKISNALILVNVTGTDRDPQNKNKIIEMYKDAGAIVLQRNASCARLAGYILQNIGGRQ
jgi:succinyl-CoA synthetase alpha subunit